MLDEIQRPQLILTRQIFTQQSTIGVINIDNLFSCNSLEDTVRRAKIPGVTAIPSGIYRMVLVTHPKFGFTIHILDVPFFDGIYFHAGNSDKDVRGCIAVGQYDSKEQNWIGQSRATHRAMMEVLEPLNKTESLLCEIRGGVTKEQMSL